jgi:hypothetical protein
MKKTHDFGFFGRPRLGFGTGGGDSSEKWSECADETPPGSVCRPFYCGFLLVNTRFFVRKSSFWVANSVKLGGGYG